MKKILIIIISSILMLGCGGGEPNKVVNKEANSFIPAPESILSSTPENIAPTITGTSKRYLLANTDYSFTPSALDLDHDDLIYAIENKPDWAIFNNESGELSGKPIEPNEYRDITISVSDGIESTSLPAFNITVQALESQPNNAPTISGTATTLINTNSDYQFIPTTTDLDADDLAFTIENKPAWATFSNVSGELRGTPIEVDEYRDITISASDGIESISLPAFNITVQAQEPESNNVPTISGAAATLINTNSDYRFIPMAIDLDDNYLTFSIENKPSWATFSNISGELKGTPVEANEYRDITISVSDGIDTSSLPAFDINVIRNLYSVAISWEAPTTDVNGDNIEGLTGYKIMYGKESEKYEYTLSIDDPSMTSTTILNLERTDHYFSMKAMTLHGIESETAIEYRYLYQNE
jgi:hypothetical protein